MDSLFRGSFVTTESEPDAHVGRFVARALWHGDRSMLTFPSSTMVVVSYVSDVPSTKPGTRVDVRPSEGENIDSFPRKRPVRLGTDRSNVGRTIPKDPMQGIKPL